MKLNPDYEKAHFEMAYKFKGKEKVSSLPFADSLRFNRDNVSEALRLMQLGLMDEVRKLSIPKWI